MVPAAIGSERKRHMPPSTTVVPPMAASDWSSVSKRKIYRYKTSEFYFLHLFLEPYPYPQQQTREYPR